MIRKISLLRYELEHTSTVSPDEMIEAMSFAKSEGSGSAPSGVSNKTLYIALNYQEAAERVNTEAMDDLSLRLFPLEQTIHRLHHYVGLLPAEEKTIIRLSCFEQKSLQEVAGNSGYFVVDGTFPPGKAPLPIWQKCMILSWRAHSKTTVLPCFSHENHTLCTQKRTKSTRITHLIPYGVMWYD